MSKKWQVIEKDDYGTDWHQVRYSSYALGRFDSENEALDAAKKYLTEVNCDNALTKEGKKDAAVAYMMTDDGVYLGNLDGEDWYLTYTKDIVRKQANGDMTVVYHKGDPIKEANYYELEGKSEVKVRPVPGT